MTHELPTDLVVHPLSVIEKRRQRIYEQGLLPCCDLPITPEVFNELVLRMRRLCAGVTAPTLFESLRYLAGTTPRRPDAFVAAWRLAANYAELVAGHPVRPWTGQHQDEWVPLEVQRGILVRTRKKELATEFTLLALAGTPCGMRLIATWSRKVCHLISRRVGYSRRGGKFPYTDPHELVGLRLYGRVLADRSRDRPVIHGVECPPGMVTWNRKNVLGLRCRQKQQCPNGWTHPCVKCAIGYETCAGATHYRTFEMRPCVGCQQAEAVFDPESRTGLCIECSRQQTLKNQ